MLSFRQQIIDPFKRFAIQITSILSSHLATSIPTFVTIASMFSNPREFYLYLSFLREFERRRMVSACQQAQLAQRTSSSEHPHERQHRRHESGSSENVIVEYVALEDFLAIGGGGGGGGEQSSGAAANSDEISTAAGAIVTTSDSMVADHVTVYRASDANVAATSTASMDVATLRRNSGTAAVLIQQHHQHHLQQQHQDQMQQQVILQNPQQHLPVQEIISQIVFVLQEILNLVFLALNRWFDPNSHFSYRCTQWRAHKKSAEAREVR